MSADPEPRLPRLLLRACLRAEDAEFVLGDLREEYERVAARFDRRAARRWYWSHALRTAATSLARRPRSPLEAWLRDVRHAGRGLLRAPGYSVTTVLTLAAGMGGVAAVTALGHSILRPLPYPDSDRLVAVWETLEGEERWVAPANYLDWRASSGSFEQLAAHDTRGASVTVDGVATRREIAVVSGNFFTVLGVGATLGRTFDSTLDAAFSAREAVLSHDAWVEAFGSARDVLGRTVRMDATTYEVVGVMPQGLDMPDPGLFAWVRSRTEAPELSGFPGDLTGMRDAWYFQVVGRLSPGRSLEAAQAEMDAIAARLETRFPDSNEGRGVRLVPLLDQTVADSESTLLTLALAVALVLLAAGVNVTHLTLARGAARKDEVAIRLSLGASGWDVRRLALIESWMVGASGGVAGLAGAVLAVRGAESLASSLPRAGEWGVRPAVAALTLVLSLAVSTGIAWVASSRQSPTAHPMRAIREAAGRPGSVGRGMIAMQVAAAIALLAGTVLMGRSVWALAAVDPGFEQSGLVTLRLADPEARGRTPQERVAMLEGVRGALAGVPGVTSVGLGSDSPLSMGARAGVVTLDAPLDGGQPPDAGWQPVTPEYFTALGAPLLQGRPFTSGDRLGTADVAIVNETFARTILGGREALGARVTMGLDGHDRPLTVVGIVRDTRTRGPAAAPGPVLYRPLQQAERFSATSVFVAVRSSPSSGPGIGALRDAIRARAPGLPIYDEATGEDLATSFRATHSALLAVLTVFATTALLLGLVGVYGIASYGVRRSRRDIGVRLALGADPARVTAEVVGGGMRTAAMGVPIGVVLALVLGRALRSLLFDVSGGDAATLAGVTVLVLAATAAALFLPGRAAARTDPAVTTRES